MKVHMLKSKIHNARVTGQDLHYEGSIKIDMDLVDEAEMFPYEKVQVVNNNNGKRFETYIIPGDRGSGEVRLNGACARLAAIQDVVIIMSFAEASLRKAKIYEPTIVLVSDQNKIQKKYKIKKD